MQALKGFIQRIVVVGIVAIFPAMLIGLALPGLIAAVMGMAALTQPATIVDLSGPKTIRTCPPGMELKTMSDTRPNYNRTGTITNISYECVGPNGAHAAPTETIEPVANPPQWQDQDWFFSSAADWLRLLAYPVSFVLVFVLSFFVRRDPGVAGSEN